MTRSPSPVAYGARTRGDGGTGLGAGNTLRTPNPVTERVMTRRGWFLVVSNLLVPGSAQVLAGSRRLGRFGLGCTLLLWLLIAGTIALWFLNRGILLTVATNPIALWAAQILLVGYALLWVVLTVDTLRLVRFVRVRAAARPTIAAFSVLTLAALSATAAYGTFVAGVTRETISDVFVAAPPEPPVDGRYNIMLLGGDAGPDREGLRPDSVSVISVDDATGKVAMLGLPRDLREIPFSEGSPMLGTYPNGYGYNNTCDVDVCQLNSIYTEVTLKSPELYPNAVAEGSEPGIEAMRDAVEGALGITVQYYVLIDMAGFEQLVNALGGVTVEVTERIPIGGRLDSDGDLVDVGAWIEPGTQHLDGNWALWYARARYGTEGGDYGRMARQRQVQEALIQQMEPANVLARFQDVAQAGAQVVKTDIPQGTLGYFTDLALKAKGQEPVDVEFVPPLIDPENPDYAFIHGSVDQALAAAAAPAEGGN